MKRIALIFLLLLTGCSTTVPVTVKFPKAPPTLTQPCPTLQTLKPDTVSIVELHTTVVNNYTLYHECAVKVDAWNEWYRDQKNIFEEIK